MKKRGFTLIEIIVCIILLGIVGTVSIVVVNKNDDKTLSKTTKKILEAANIYIETEKDKDGNTYAYGINNGGKGVTIPLKELVNSGYVSEKDSKEVKDLTKLENDDKYFVLLANANDLCETGSILEIASWNIDSDEGTLYLCDNVISLNGGENNKTLSEHIIEIYGNDKIYEINNFTENEYSLKVDHQSFRCDPTCAVFLNDNYENNYTDTIGWFDPANCKVLEIGNEILNDIIDIDTINNDDYSSNLSYSGSIHGLVKLKTEDTYYFTGMVENNYVNIGDKAFKILSFKDDSITLVGNFLIEIKNSDEGIVYKSVISDNYKKADSRTNKMLDMFAKDLANSIGINSTKLNDFYNEFNIDSNNNLLARTLNTQDMIQAGSYIFDGNLELKNDDVFINSFINYNSNILKKHTGTINYLKSYSIYDLTNSKFLNLPDTQHAYQNMSLNSLENTYKIRPVIKIKVNNISWTGNGTENSPFVITYKD